MLLKRFATNWISHPVKLSFLAGLLFTTVGLFFAIFLLRNQPHLIGISAVFFTVLLAFPLFDAILRKEENLEKTNIPFLKKNRSIITYHLYFFLGVLAVFTVAAIVQPSYVFNIHDFLGEHVHTAEHPADMTLHDDFSLLFRILINNIYIVAAFFLFMVFFGAGGLVLILLNASMAGAFIAELINSNFFTSTCNIMLFNIHFLLEMTGFLLAGIAGGIFIMDLATEKIWSKQFINVTLNCSKLLTLSVVAVASAAVLEVFVTKPLFQSGVCTTHAYIPSLILLVVILSFAVFEIVRLKNPSIK